MLRLLHRLALSYHVRRVALRSDIAPDFVTRVFRVRWWSYRTAIDFALLVPLHIVELASSDTEVACRGGAILDGELCHQHVQFFPVISPALPFVFEVLDMANDEVLSCGLDVILGAAIGTNLRRIREVYGAEADLPKWAKVTRKYLVNQTPRLRAISRRGNAELDEQLRGILDEINDSETPNYS